MFHNSVDTNNAPAPGNYKQGRIVDLGAYLVLYTAGQTGNQPKNDTVVPGGIGPQTRQAIENIRGVVEAAGGKLEDIVKVTVFMKDMARDKKGFEEVYRAFFKESYPARSLVEVSEIPLVDEDTIIELDAVAYIKK